MKQAWLIVGMLFVFAFAKAQQFISHQVITGETVYSISKKYNVSEDDIYKFNPDAKERIYEGLVLILPDTDAKTAGGEIIPPQEDITFKIHRVKRKETLFSISQQYNIPIDIIKKYNKRLYSKSLRKGYKLRIPTNYQKTVATVVEETTPTAPAKTTTYAIKAKETKYGIARSYGITLEELEALNPDMSAVLGVGQIINVPNSKPQIDTTIDTSKYEWYEVLKGDTMYSLLRRINLKADDLIALNPALDDGLKEGMILKIPSTEGYTITSDGTLSPIGDKEKVNLADSIAFSTPKRLAIMLPFGLSKVQDSVAANADLIKDNRVLRIALDFHSGVLLALEKAKAIGINVDATIYDTDYVREDGASANARKVEDLINNNDFSNVDAVIGPVLGDNINRAASVLASQNVPVISPITTRVKMSNNIFQSRPSDLLLKNKMLDYLKAHGEGKNIILIADHKSAAVKAKIKVALPNLIEVNPRSSDKGIYLYPDDISSKLSKTLDNWVILETNDLPLISLVTTSLNTQIEDMAKITLLTCKKGDAYRSNEIHNTHLTNLNFHYPSIDKEYNSDKEDSFFELYEEVYGESPGEYAIRGYDITLDTILRLAYAGNLFDAAGKGIETGYVENKFHYVRHSGGGYHNEAVYLMKYGPNLSLEEVVIEKTSETD